MTGVSLRAVVEHRDVDVEFDVSAGEVLAVLGPNGAGKSTVLHVLAGLVRPDDGFVRVGERVLTDTASGVHVPTHDRRVGLLLQDPLLFPHLDVTANVSFAPRSTRPEHWLEQTDAMHLADRRPRQLSGGEAQRVALARALAAEPDVLLLDEPLAGLDVAAAAAMRKVLGRVLARDGRSAVLVTHDVLDVATLADRAVVLESGRVVESGSAATVLATPRSAFGAQLAGVNLVRGTAAGDGVLSTRWGSTWYGIPGADVAVDSSAVALFHPTAVAVYRDPPHGSPRNTIKVTVAELDARGPAIRVRAEEQPDGGPGLAADITADAAAALRLAPGEQVYFAVKAQEVAIHPDP
ncbi:sulfate/molybdate ABC transporter ATP-binding protein [Mycobacterium sp. E740]|uniref:sulfate/molybdate ABC transporter ATP-binding protein n=1 Tax=Mycobacterium sp. E740 TaxID=1834149 RepID=UPI00080104DF|nr:ATP-binding cassette domain-containing protein [Mycobacterium sp. E740]OBI74800.1 molybdenum ABC transporter ATP-binding protein [Mycobacterium sp. E740]